MRWLQSGGKMCRVRARLVVRRRKVGSRRAALITCTGHRRGAHKVGTRWEQGGATWQAGCADHLHMCRVHEVDTQGGCAGWAQGRHEEGTRHARQAACSCFPPLANRLPIVICKLSIEDHPFQINVQHNVRQRLRTILALSLSGPLHDLSPLRLTTVNCLPLNSL